MNIDDIKNICVVGAGNMGHQISLLCAMSGYKTTCTDINEEILKKAEEFADSYLAGRVKKEKLTEEQANEARANISFSLDLEEAVKDADYVIEAAIEVIDIKRKIFAELDRLAPEHAILATNSSAIVSSRIADATNRPSKVVNLHFFNPALVMKLVEVVKGEHVSDETAEISLALCEKLGKVGIPLEKEVDGFVVNRILFALWKEAQWLLEMGVATYEDIDKACVYGVGHPMGPFRLMDLVGLDLAYTLDIERFRRTGDPADTPAPTLSALHAQGNFGEKSGKGWYDYPKK